MSKERLILNHLLEKRAGVDRDYAIADNPVHVCPDHRSLGREGMQESEGGDIVPAI